MLPSQSSIEGMIDIIVKRNIDVLLVENLKTFFCANFRQYLNCSGVFSQQPSKLDSGRISGDHPGKVIPENRCHPEFRYNFVCF